MATFDAKGAVDPSITPNRAGEVLTIAKEFDLADYATVLTVTPLATNDIIRFGKLPANCAVVDCTVNVDAAIAALAADIGVLNAAGDDTGAELFTAQALATASTVRVGQSQWPETKAVSDQDEWIAAKLTAGTAAVAGKVTVILSYRQLLLGV